MNVFEKKVKKYLECLGYEVLRNGYPDFMIRRIGRYDGLACVEVKNRKDKLRPEQVKMIDALKKVGLPTYILRPQDFENSENSHELTPTGKPKKIGRCKKVISGKDYSLIYNKINEIKNSLESRQEWWFNEILSTIDRELSLIFEALDSIKEAEEFLKCQGIVIEVDKPEDILREGK
jgi:hypothetical protein